MTTLLILLLITIAPFLVIKYQLTLVQRLIFDKSDGTGTGLIVRCASIVALQATIAALAGPGLALVSFIYLFGLVLIDVTAYLFHGPKHTSSTHNQNP